MPVKKQGNFFFFSHFFYDFGKSKLIDFSSCALSENEQKENGKSITEIPRKRKILNIIIIIIIKVEMKFHCMACNKKEFPSLPLSFLSENAFCIILKKKQKICEVNA